MTDLTELPYGPFLTTPATFKGITVVENDTGDEAIVAEFHDNVAGGQNRIHRFVSLFKHAERMERLLKDLAGIADLDGTPLAPATPQERLGQFQHAAGVLLDAIKAEEQLSSTDQGIEALQGYNVVDAEILPGATAQEIGEISMPDLVGDYVRPEEVPEWDWVQRQAVYSHVRNGTDGIWEFVLNLSVLHYQDPVPEKLQGAINAARSKHIAYLIVHQNT
jgi:hypothetical protein